MTSYSDKIYLGEALQAFASIVTPALRVFSTDFSGATRGKGDAVIVPLISTLSTTTFSYTNNSAFPYEGSGGTISAVTVNLDNHQIVPVELDDVTFSNSTAASLANFGKQAGAALGKKVLQNILSLVTTTAFGTALTSLSIASFSRAAILAGRTAMVKRDVPVDECSLVVNADVNDALLSDSSIYSQYSYGLPTLQTGTVPKLLGMPVYESNVVPLNAVSLVGFIAHQSAIAVAMRQIVPQEPGAYASVETMTDAAGISMTYRRHYNPGRGKHFLNVECLFGYSAGATLGLGVFTRKD